MKPLFIWSFLLFNVMAFNSIAAENTAEPAANEQAPNTAEQNKQPITFQTQEVFGDWPVNCVYQEVWNENKETTGQAALLGCQAPHTFMTKEKQPILYTVVAYTQDAKGNIASRPSLYFQAPVNVFLKPQIIVKVDGQSPITFYYSNCNQAGCFASEEISKQFEDKLRKGSKVDITFSINPEQPITLTLPLTGFTKATEYLSEQIKSYGTTIPMPEIKQAEAPATPAAQ
ncbi:MAG: invasion associated locus B family protein [Alphaproteobacteria bacterium]